MEQRMLSVGHIGVGGYGEHRRMLMRKTGLFRIVAAYDISQEALKRAVQQEGCVAATSYEAMLDAPGLEGVFISTGAKFHASQVLAALERGLPVFVEKPLCCTEEETFELHAAVARTRGIVVVGHNTHAFDPSSATIKTLIEEGRLGNIACFEKTTAHNGGFMIGPGDWRGDPNKNPGGMLFQCGVHGLHELRYFFGTIREVYCTMRYDVHSTQTADVAMVHLTFENGIVGTLNAYHVTPYRHTFSIFGTKANVYRDDRFYDEGTKVFLQESRLDNHKEPLVEVPVLGEDDPTASLRSFYDAITRGADPSPSLADGIEAVQTVFAAEKSFHLRRPIEIPRWAGSQKNILSGPACDDACSRC
jgi:myo-inositol 2-dehydrogenase / D-chiro-inositol 1-dehydrogenase